MLVKAMPHGGPKSSGYDLDLGMYKRESYTEAACDGEWVRP